jgi:hypothetical protein
VAIADRRIASLAAIPAWLAMLFEAALRDAGAAVRGLLAYLGPTFAMVQSLVDPRMRAVAPRCSCS